MNEEDFNIEAFMAKERALSFVKFLGMMLLLSVLLGSVVMFTAGVANSISKYFHQQHIELPNEQP